jgi:hypothetical protein
MGFHFQQPKGHSINIEQAGTKMSEKKKNGIFITPEVKHSRQAVKNVSGLRGHLRGDCPHRILEFNGIGWRLDMKNVRENIPVAFGRIKVQEYLVIVAFS